MPIETIFAGAAAWILSEYGKTITEKTVKAAWDKTGQTAWEKWREDKKWRAALADYQAAIRRDHGHLRIIGKPGPVPLEGLFTDVYMLDRPTALRRYDVDALRQEFENSNRRFGSDWFRDEKRQNGLELVRQPGNTRLFILGKPGAGKTTFLKYIALQADSLHKVPIFITLKSWSTGGQALAEFIAGEFELCHFPAAQPFIEYILRTGQALVLFDGLDEVNHEGGLRRRLIGEMENFSRRYPASQMLLTCRIAATEHAFDRFTYVELADFTRKQIDTFVAKWFSHAPEKLEAFRTEFYHADNKGLHELAATPILLALLCLAFEDTMTFARQRAQLYEDAIDALLRRWDSERSIKRDDDVYKDLTLKRKQRLFAHLAATGFEAGDIFFKQDRLEREIEAYLGNLPNAPAEIDGRAVLKAIEAQHGILVERAKAIYSFSHLTFQEYFTARYIVEHNRYGLAMPHLADNRWREVFLLTASQAAEADDFFKEFRRALDGLINTDPALVDLLRWANRKSQDEALPPAKAAALKAYYIFLDRNLAHDLARTLALDLVFNLTRSFDRNYDLARVRTHAFNLNLNLNLDRDFALNLDLARALAFDRGPAVDYLLTTALLAVETIEMWGHEDESIRAQIGPFSAYFQNMVSETSRVSPPLAAALAALNLPDEAAPSAAWREFNGQLRRVLLEQRGLGREWNFSEAQADTLEAYLAANQLLLECLEVAYVSNRDAIKASLLLPPGEWEF